MSIEAARTGFEKSFEEANFYNKQTQDEKHLKDILATINVKPGMKILDLGCGSGYLTFPIAEGNENVHVVGADHSFDLVITRYALHHFPEIKKSIREVARVLTCDGLFFLSDPRRNDGDITRFVDGYMQLKKDGHIKFYTKEEWSKYAENAICISFVLLIPEFVSSGKEARQKGLRRSLQNMKNPLLIAISLRRQKMKFG